MGSRGGSDKSVKLVADSARTDHVLLVQAYVKVVLPVATQACLQVADRSPAACIAEVLSDHGLTVVVPDCEWSGLEFRPLEIIGCDSACEPSVAVLLRVLQEALIVGHCRWRWVHNVGGRDVAQPAAQWRPPCL